MQTSREKRWYRFSLRTLLMLVTIGSVCFGWLGVKMRAKQREREAVAVIKRLGGHAYYDYELTDYDLRDGRNLIDSPVPPGPAWLRRIFGDDVFANVVSVSLMRVERTLEDERHLRAFPKLEFLYLNGMVTTDATLAHLEGMKRLRGLDLCNAEITDDGLKHLQELTQLQGLELSWTPITDAGLVHLGGLTELKQLDLRATDVSDKGLVHLAGLKQLKWLGLGGKQITDEGKKELQEALPNLKTYR